MRCYAFPSHFYAFLFTKLRTIVVSGVCQRVLGHFRFQIGHGGKYSPSWWGHGSPGHFELFAEFANLKCALHPQVFAAFACSRPRKVPVVHFINEQRLDNRLPILPANLLKGGFHLGFLGFSKSRVSAHSPIFNASSINLSRFKEHCLWSLDKTRVFALPIVISTGFP